MQPSVEPMPRPARAAASSRLRRTVQIFFLFALLAQGASALSYLGGSHQFAGGFSPGNAPYGGFGGGSCTASRTPIVFVHGNGDEAKNWDYPSSTDAASVYDALRADGYSDCELFGITWLSSGQRASPQLNAHQSSQGNRIADFLWDVKAYTGSSQVDIVGHSMGVTVALEGIDANGLWSSIRRFVGISGGMRGLASCYAVGYANALAPTCGSQNLYLSDYFGFYPHSWWVWNPRLGNGGFRDLPSGKGTLFYTLRADVHDQVLCGTASSYPGCGGTALFDSRSNVKSQLDIGHGSTAVGLDFDFSDWTIFNLAGGDADGVGHFRSRNNAGRLLINMLRTSCTGTGCCSGYGAPCGN